MRVELSVLVGCAPTTPGQGATSVATSCRPSLALSPSERKEESENSPTLQEVSPTLGGSCENPPGEDAEVALPPPPRPAGRSQDPGNRTPNP